MFLLTALCQFSKFGICVPLRNKEAITVAKALVDHVFLKWGMAHCLLTDQGSKFEADLLAELAKILGITRLRTSAYFPQANGAVESWHRTLNAMFAKCVGTDQKD